MTKQSTRRRVFFCNLIIAALCILSIAAYFFLPVWKVTVSLKLDGETMQSMMQEASPESAEPTSVFLETVEGGENPDGENPDGEQSKDPLSDIDFKEVMGDEVITIDLSIEIKSADAISSLGGNATATVQTILDDNVNKMVDQINEPLQKMTKTLMEGASKSMLKSMMYEELRSLTDGEDTNEELKQTLDEAGITDEYIQEKSNALVDAFYAEDATVDSVSDAMIAIMEDVQTKLATVDEQFDVELTDADKQEIKDTLAESLSELADENGSIDMENFIAELLLKTLKDEQPSEEANAGVSPVSVQALAEEANSNPELETSAKEDLKAELRAMLLETLGEDTAQSISEALKYVSYVLFFTFFTWIYVIIKILVKMGMTNNTVKMKLPIWLGNIPFVVLYLLPTVMIALLKNPPSFLVGMLGGEAAAAEMAKTFSMFNVSFFSCAWISFGVSVFFIFFSLFYYGKLRRRLKKYKRGLLVDEEEEY